MPSKLQRRHLIISLCAAVVLSVLAAGQYQRLFERGWFNLQQLFGHAPAQSLGLDDYRAVIQGQAIDGLPSDVSALAFDPERHSLYTVTNKHSELVELSLDGVLLRRIALRGFGDPEGVEYIRPGTLVISDEGGQRLLAVQVDDQTRELFAADASQLALDFAHKKNRGFEGLAYDRDNGRLFVANESAPMSILQISGFPQLDGTSTAVQVTENRKGDDGLFVRDLSSLDFDERHGHLLALSDQSRLLLELDAQLKPVSTLSLRAGFHGLHSTVPQAEGVTLGDDGTLYVVSEPNLFYVFKKPAAQR